MCCSECSLPSLAAFITYCRLHWLAPRQTRYEPRRFGDADLSAATMRTRGRGPVRGAAERKEERRAVRQVAGWAPAMPFNLSPTREIPHIEDPGSLYLAALDSQRWPKRITSLMLSTACICKYFVSGQWAVPTGDPRARTHR